MDEQRVSQEKPIIVTTNPSSILNNKFFICFLILLVGILIGYFSYSMLSFGKSSVVSTPQAINTTPQTPSQPFITEDKSPVSISLLTNPIVYEWRGNIAGKLIQVNPDSYVIRDDKGNSVTLFLKTADIERLDPVFQKLVGKVYENVKLGEVPIGTAVSGEFFIYKGSPNTPVGTIFQIVP